MKASEYLLRRFGERPIAFMPLYADLAGSIVGGLVLSQLMYWAERVGYREFYKTDAELADELRMCRKTVTRVKKRIEKLPFICVNIRGVPARTYYSIDMDAFEQAVQKMADASSDPRRDTKSQPDGTRSPNQMGLEVPTRWDRESQLLTETTAKMTTEKKDDGKKTKTIHTKYTDLSERFHKLQQVNYPQYIKRVDAKTILDGAIELQRAVKRDGFDFTHIKKALLWLAKNPTHFWNANLRSLRTCRKSCKDGITKLAHVLEAYDKDHSTASPKSAARQQPTTMTWKQAGMLRSYRVTTYRWWLGLLRHLCEGKSIPPRYQPPYKKRKEEQVDGIDPVYGPVIGKILASYAALHQETAGRYVPQTPDLHTDFTEFVRRVCRGQNPHPNGIPKLWEAYLDNVQRCHGYNLRTGAHINQY